MGTGVVTLALFTGASSISRVTTSGNGTSEVLATYPSAINANSIASATAISIASSISDALQTPIDYSSGTWGNFFFMTFSVVPPVPYNVAASSATWPSPLASATHRVSDLMLDIPPPATGAYDPNSYFSWPIYAKDQLTRS